MTILNTFLSWATDKGYYSGLNRPRFKAPGNDITHIALTFEELKKLYYYKFVKARLARVRNIYCFGCLTGLRFSDLMKLRREHLKDRFIHITTQKTNDRLIIPVVKAAKRILDNYNHPVQLLPEISNDKFNEYIKECCNLAGINETNQVEIFVGNTRTDKYKLKHQLITAHTSRKTFVTLSSSRGVDDNVIKSITGHKGDRVFGKYLKVDEQIKLKQMDKAWGKL